MLSSISLSLFAHNSPYISGRSIAHSRDTVEKVEKREEQKGEMIIPLSAALWAIASMAEVNGQTVAADGCLRLLGSVACPGCKLTSYYINSHGLSEWKAATGVSDLF